MLLGKQSGAGGGSKRGPLIGTTIGQLLAKLLDCTIHKMEPTAATYQELSRAFDFFNAKLFDGQLPACLLTLQREKRTYGVGADRNLTHP